MNNRFRSFLMKLHVLLAGFFMPVALMFLITGIYNTLDVKGANAKERYTVRLQEPLRPELPMLSEVAMRELERLNIDYPAGEIHLRSKGGRFWLSWHGSNHTVRLKTTADPLVGSLEVTIPGWLSRMQKLHKAGGSTMFKFYAIAWGGGLALLLLSGIAMSWQSPRLRTLAMYSMGFGTLAFVLLFYHSVTTT